MNVCWYFLYFSVCAFYVKYCIMKTDGCGAYTRSFGDLSDKIYSEEKELDESNVRDYVIKANISRIAGGIGGW